MAKKLTSEEFFNLPPLDPSQAPSVREQEDYGGVGHGQGNTPGLYMDESTPLESIDAKINQFKSFVIAVNDALNDIDYRLKLLEQKEKTQV